MQESHKKPELSSIQHGCIGGMVGAIEQAIMRPSVFWKAQLQQDRFSLATALNPRYAYRGLPVAVASIAPVTAVQFASAHAFMNMIKYSRGSNADAREADRFCSSAFAGTASAMVQTPFQLVEVNQQNSGGSMTACARRTLATYGIQGLYRGGSMTIVREGIFCTAYMALAPSVKEKLLRRQPDMSEGTALLISSVISGTLGATLSHPADTLKTRLQGSLFADVKPAGPREALRDMRRQGPLLGQVYRGFAPRVFRIVCCTYIYSNLTTTFEAIARSFLLRASFERASFEPLEVGLPAAKAVTESLASTAE